MKKKVSGYEARSDKVIKGIVMLLLLITSLMPLTVSAGTAPSTSDPVVTPTPTPTPMRWSHEVPEPIQQQATPAVSWNS